MEWGGVASTLSLASKTHPQLGWAGGGERRGMNLSHPVKIITTPLYDLHTVTTIDGRSKRLHNPSWASQDSAES